MLISECLYSYESVGPLRVAKKPIDRILVSQHNSPTTNMATSTTAIGSVDRHASQKQGVQDMRTLLGSTGNQVGWDQAWQKGLTPWETMLGNVAQPSLRWACEQDEKAMALIPQTGRALVPGCGRGQDVAYLAERGLSTIGLDISPTAVQAARTWLNSQGQELEWQERASVECVDYFDLSKGPGSDAKLSGIDMIYDYT